MSVQENKNNNISDNTHMHIPIPIAIPLPPDPSKMYMKTKIDIAKEEEVKRNKYSGLSNQGNLLVNSFHYRKYLLFK